jgi:hypothetical protein
MPVASAPVSAIFLILVAASTAVVVSMVVLALFDRALVKKKPPAAKEQKHEQPGSSPKRTTGMGRSKPKPSAVLKHQSKVRYQAGCGPQNQRVRNFG